MTRIFGYALAIHGSTKVSSTLLEADAKDNVRIRSTRTRDLRNITRNSARRLFSDLGEEVRSLAREASDVPVSIITGTELGYNGRELVEALSRGYGDLAFCFDAYLGDDIVTLGGVNVQRSALSGTIRTLCSQARTPQDKNQVLMGTVCGVLLDAAGEYKDRLEIVPARDYASMKAQMAEAQPGEVAIDVGTILDQAAPTLEPVFELYSQGSEDAHAQLVTTSYELARELSLLADTKGHRFFDMSDDFRSRLIQVPGCREAYAKGLMSILGYYHNICVKGRLDPRSPPFSDVAATYIGDHFDRLEGTTPGVVLVRHD